MQVYDSSANIHGGTEGSDAAVSGSTQCQVDVATDPTYAEVRHIRIWATENNEPFTMRIISTVFLQAKLIARLIWVTDFVQLGTSHLNYLNIASNTCNTLKADNAMAGIETTGAHQFI